MYQLVGITFNGKTVSMPRQNLSAEKIVKLFNTKKNGLPLKVKKGLLWQKTWPTSSSENRIPENVTTTLLIAMPNNISPDPPNPRNKDKACQSECICSKLLVFITTRIYVTVIE